MTTIETVKFSGTVIRIERDGFGLVQFDNPIGPNANSSFGLFSNSTGTVIQSRAGTIIQSDDLRPGVRVSGTAEADERDVAVVRTVVIADS
jgi:hypothetical protein